MQTRRTHYVTYSRYNVGTCLYVCCQIDNSLLIAIWGGHEEKRRGRKGGKGQIKRNKMKRET